MRVAVSNIDYNVDWKELKSLFTEHVCDPTYVEIFFDKSGKSTGKGMVDVPKKDLVDIAIERLHNYCLRGRRLVVQRADCTNKDERSVLAVNVSDF